MLLALVQDARRALWEHPYLYRTLSSRMLIIIASHPPRPGPRVGVGGGHGGVGGVGGATVVVRLF